MPRTHLLALATALLVAPAASGAARAAAPAVPRLVPHLPTRRSASLADRLAGIGATFDGQVGIFVEDLESGAYAGWNADSQLPAASTVKLGVIAEGIRRFGYGSGSPIDADLRAIGAWSSNRSANRIFKRVGGVGPTEAALRRLGMFSSTYPVPYKLSPFEKQQLRKAKKKPKQPVAPARHTAGVSIDGHTRVTTARDLARALFRLQAAAAGQRWAIDATELAADQARAALGYLSLATPGAGLLAFPAGTSHVEKDGWTDDVRGSAALVYGPGYARIVVVLAYRPGVTLAEARALGERVSRLAFKP